MSINVFEKSKEFSNREIYKMTQDAGIGKISDHDGEELQVAGYVRFTDGDKEVLSILSADGHVLATNSATFTEAFINMYETMSGEDFTLKILSGESKNGRTYYTCSLV